MPSHYYFLSSSNAEISSCQNSGQYMTVYMGLSQRLGFSSEDPSGCQQFRDQESATVIEPSNIIRGKRAAY